MIERFKKYRAGKDRVSARDLNRRGDALYGLLQSAGNDCFVDSTGVHFLNRRNAQSHRIKRAKIQADGVGVASITAKLLDSSGAEIGSDITVYPIEHLGTNNLSGSVWPDLKATDIISIFKDIDGKYYTTFVFDDTTTC